MFIIASYSNSAFDVVVSGIVPPYSTKHSIDQLGEVCRLLRPGGTLVIQQAVDNGSNGGTPEAEKIVSLLKLSGFVQVEQVPSLLSSQFIIVRNLHLVTGR